MRNLSRVILVFVLLLLVTSIASAGGPELASFSTTGYTPTFPVFEPLSGDYIKFSILAEGSPGDATCAGLAGEACGTDGFFYDLAEETNGSFIFEEWGLYYPETAPRFMPDGTPIVGTNHGILDVWTSSGQSNLRFGGLAVPDLANYPALDVIGSFQVLDGEGDYKGLKGEGTYTGDADFVFSVDYEPLNFTPCEGDDCPDRCAVFGTDYKIKKDGVEVKDIKLKKDKLEWEIVNEGEGVLTVSNISLWWPAGAMLDKVKYGGKTVFGESDAGYINIPLSGWEGKEKDIQLKNGKKAKLEFEFENKEISQNPWDYTILVEFDNGCAVTFVDFDPDPPTP